MENGDGKLLFVCLLQKEKENGSLFSLVGKRLMVVDYDCFSKGAHLS
jgi:hypothetical protein